MSITIEARDKQLGEPGRRGGHLAGAGYTKVGKENGKKGAKFSAERHSWALNNVVKDFARAGSQF